MEDSLPTMLFIGRSRCATALADRACHPEGMCWCAALDRTRDAMRLAPLTWGVEKRTLLLSEEPPDTIPISHKSCHSAPQMLACESQITSVVLLRPIDLMYRATCPAFSRTFVPSHDT